jgi:general secretion pathway protein G
MTLIEIMVVLAIISLILGGIGVMAVGQWDRARLKQAYNDALQAQTNSELFKVAHNRCPRSIQELVAAGIVGRMTRDPWGNDYEIRCTDDEQIDVATAGPDREMGTDDDITSNGEPPSEDAGEGADADASPTRR